MPLLFLPDLRLHYTDDGPRTGPPVVFAHALGTDLRLWDNVLPLLPPGLRHRRCSRSVSDRRLPGHPCLNA